MFSGRPRSAAMASDDRPKAAAPTVYPEWRQYRETESRNLASVGPGIAFPNRWQFTQRPSATLSYTFILALYTPIEYLDSLVQLRKLLERWGLTDLEDV